MSANGKKNDESPFHSLNGDWLLVRLDPTSRKLGSLFLPEQLQREAAHVSGIVIQAGKGAELDTGDGVHEKFAVVGTRAYFAAKFSVQISEGLVMTQDRSVIAILKLDADAPVPTRMGQSLRDMAASGKG